ncbi:hypothetical protein HZC27_04740 [Candidatus Roizmanbacteria bacterium]|nr:hypothetical protein [Candidatus Roizmanbacteria bacterium]
MNLLTSKKTLLIGGAVVLIIGAASYYFFMPKNGQNENALKTNNVLNQGENVAPTVDASVKVQLTSGVGKKDAELKVEEVPPGTQTVEYELSYQEKQKGLQGVLGTVTLGENQKEFNKQITLGTCSSGRCVYHEVVGKVKATLKFSGSYGDKIFEKEYEM